MVLAGSGRCGSTLLQSILNTNPEFLIWGEHNGFLGPLAAAFYDAEHPQFPDRSDLDAAQRMERLRDAQHWPAWDNLVNQTGFTERFRAFIRSFFADPTGRAARWGFKEIRYGHQVDVRALSMMFDCFPETRLIVLIREPEATIFSILSHWVFSGDRNGNLNLDELDQRILETARSWREQYLHFDCLVQANVSYCLKVRYEDLAHAKTYQALAKFLETSSFDYASHLCKVKDPSNKTRPTAILIRQRIEALQQEIDAITSEVQAAYGYSHATERRRLTVTK